MERGGKRAIVFTKNGPGPHIQAWFQLWALFPFPPTSLKHEFYALTSGFTRLIMKTKYVCHNLISLHVNFHDNRKKRTVTLNIKICRWGEKEKEPNSALHD